MRRWIGGGLASLLAVVLLAAASVSTAVAADSSLDPSAADRSLVPAGKLTDRPFRGIVLVAVGNNVVCTGFVIAPRKVATAAHCLTRDAARGNYRLKAGLPGNIRLLRAYSRAAGGSPYPACRVSRVWAHQKFVRRDRRDRRYGSRAHDYAVLTTEPSCRYPANAIMRMWATTPGDGNLGAGMKTRMAGYPADPRFRGMTGLNLWRTEGRIRATGRDTRLISTTGFVAQGMSGAPVWRSYKSDSPCGRAQCVIAILTECEVNAKGLCKTGDSTRRAIRITPVVKRILRSR